VVGAALHRGRFQVSKQRMLVTGIASESRAFHLGQDEYRNFNVFRKVKKES
jgi:hypothetical protein